jgi:hypothetical protein
MSLELDPFACGSRAERYRPRRIDFVLGDPATVPATIKVISYLLCRDLDAQCTIFSDDERSLLFELCNEATSVALHEVFLNTLAGRVAFRDWLTGPELDS